MSMSTSRIVSVLAAALLTSGAQAQVQTTPPPSKFYAGVSLAGGGVLRYRASEGGPLVDDHVLFGRLYGGYAFTDSFALEGGYAAYQDAHWAKADTGASSDASLQAALSYLAVRGTYRFNEDWSASGKLGIARHTQHLKGGGGSFDVSRTRPMFALGMAYDITPKVAVTLDLSNYGTVRTDKSKLTVGKLEVGMRFGF